MTIAGAALALLFSSTGIALGYGSVLLDIHPADAVAFVKVRARV